MGQLRRGSVAAVAAVLLWAMIDVLNATGAGAHIDTDPAQVSAGAPVTVLFTVQHGCGQSPTVELTFAVPAGVTAMTGVPKEGWQVTNAGGTVTFGAGELDAHTVGQFGLSFTATTPGSRPFPMVQRCRVGELSWISVVQPGQSEPDYPAPVVEVLASAAPTAPSTTSTTSTTAATSSTDGRDDSPDDHNDHDEVPVSTELATGAREPSPTTLDPAESPSITYTALALLIGLGAAAGATVLVGVRRTKRG